MTVAPELSMLWESADPAGILTQRFGFADASETVDWLSGVLQDSWGLAVSECERLVMSADNVLAWVMTADCKRVIAKWSVAPEKFQRLSDTTSLVAWLDGRGVPVAAPIPARDGRLRIELDGVSLGVSPVIEGGLLDVDDPAQVAEAGRMLAWLHEELAAYPHPIDGHRQAGTSQLVQNDFRSANILHDGTTIVAVLDFEDTACRRKIADLARAAVLLGTRYHDWTPTSAPVREAFIDAYGEQTPLTAGELCEVRDGIDAVLGAFGWERPNG